MSISSYRKAFKLYINDTKFELKKEPYSSSYLAKTKDKLYRISTYKDLENDYAIIVTDPDYAAHVPVSVWSEVAENFHQSAEFHQQIINANSLEEVQHLNLAFTISLASNDPSASFWHTLSYLNSSLYGQAISAVAKISNLKIVIEHLVELLVENGREYLNEFDEGVFESVDLMADNDNDSDIYYIYTVDVDWE